MVRDVAEEGAGGQDGVVRDGAPAAASRLGGGVGVVVVNFASHRLLDRALHGVAGHEAFTPIVVDNYSNATERAATEQLCRQRGWTFVGLDDNRGFGAGCNAGAAVGRQAGCDILVFLNPDALMDRSTALALSAHVRENPNDVVAPVIVDSTGKVVFRGSFLDLGSGRLGWSVVSGGDDPRSCDSPRPWITGACFALTARAYGRLGGFDDDYFLYWEDVDLSWRAQELGMNLRVREDLRVVHDEGGTQGASGHRAKSRGYYYFNCRNRLVFAAKNLPVADARRWMRTTPRESWQIFLRGGRRQLISRPGGFVSTVTGSLAGVREVRRRGKALSDAAGASPRQVLVAHPSAELYGSDRVLLETVTGLIQAHNQVTVALPVDGPLRPALEAEGANVVVVRMPVIRKSALRPVGFVRLLRDAVLGSVAAVPLIRNSGRDGVYVNTITIPSWLVLARLLRRGSICHVHEAERSAPRPLRLMLNLPLLAADRLLVNSSFSRDVLTQDVGRLADRSQIVLNGVPGPTAPQPARRALQAPVRILFIGRLSPRKGPQVALAAVSELVREGADVQLDLLGSVYSGYEWFEDELRHAAGAELAGRVRFLGFEADVWPRMEQADIILIPSVVDEPFGNTAVEAVLSQRPSVVSDTSGLREASAGYRSALLVPPDDPAAIAAAVRRITENWADYREWAVEDARLAEQRHSVEAYRHSVAEAVRRISG